MSGASEGSFGQVLSDYARLVGLGSVQADAEGVVALRFDDRLVLHFKQGPTEDEAVIYARLADAPPPERSAMLMRTMLEANLLGDGAGGCLALDPRDGAPMLVHRMRLQGMSGTAFHGIVADLVAAGHDWEDAFSPQGEDDAPPEPVHPAASSGFMRV